MFLFRRKHHHPHETTAHLKPRAPSLDATQEVRRPAAEPPRLPPSPGVSTADAARAAAGLGQALRARAVDLERIRALFERGNLALEIFDGEMPTGGAWKPRHWNTRLASVPMLAIKEGSGYSFRRDGDGDGFHLVERTGIAQWCRLVGGAGEPIFGMPCYVAGSRSAGNEWGLELEKQRLDAREQISWWLSLEVKDERELVELLAHSSTPAAAIARFDERARKEPPPAPVGFAAVWRSAPPPARALIFMSGGAFVFAVLIVFRALAEAIGRAGY